MKTIEEMFSKAKSAKRESKYVEFKKEFDINTPGALIEVIKDVVAMANTGLGVILFGVKENGDPSGFDVSAILKYDPAKLTDQINKYTGVQYSDFEIREIDKKGFTLGVLMVFGISIPMVFIRPGTYKAGDKQKTAFSKGTVYFRHGAKSEPGNSSDIRKVIERELENIRKSWLGNVKKVITAPSNSIVEVLTMGKYSEAGIIDKTYRIVTDPEALGVRVDTDKIYPYRQKEVIEQVNERLAGVRKINQYDILSIRTKYNINEKRSEYCFASEYGPKQYSEAFVDWIIESYEKNNRFFDKARKTYKKKTKKKA